MLSLSRDYLPEVLLDDFRVLPQRRVHVTEQHALTSQFVPVAVVDDLALVLSSHAGEVLPLRLGYTQLVIGGLHRIRQLVPGADLPVDGLDVVEDVVEVDAREVAAPRGHRPALEIAQRLQAALGHPLGLAFHPGHLPHDVLVETFLRFEDVKVLDIAPAQLITAEVKFLGDSSHPASLRRGFLLRR